MQFLKLPDIIHKNSAILNIYIYIFIYLVECEVVQLTEALSYKPGGRGFDSR